MEYLVIFEKGEHIFGADVPDLPGCAAVEETMDTARGLITGAIQFHIDGLREDGCVVPPPSSTVAFMDAAAV